MTNVTYIYSRLLLGFLVVSTSYCSALIHAASQSRTTLLAYSRPPLIESGLLRLGGPTNFFQLWDCTLLSLTMGSSS